MAKTINPITNRFITIGKATHRKLVKLQNRIETLLQSKIPVKPWVLRARIESFQT